MIVMSSVFRLRKLDIWVIYFAKFTDAVYVLHCFQKKTLKTSTHMQLASARF